MLTNRDKNLGGQLFHCRNGAILVMGVFMAAFATGMLYYLVGLADAMFMQERMQDAADSAAYGAALVRARGMNILVLINLLMASLMAILILLRMVVTVFKAAALFAIGLFLVPGAIPAAGHLYNAAKRVENIADGYENVAMPVLRGADATSNLIRRLVPQVANVKLVTIPKEHFSPPAEGGVPTDFLRELPTYDGDFLKLCLKATSLAKEGAALPLKLAPILPGMIAKFIGSLIEEMVGAYGDYYCGKTNTPPSAKRKITQIHPKYTHPDYVSCENGEAAACHRFGDIVEKLKNAYEPIEGECHHVESDIENTCTRRTRIAREACEPGTLVAAEGNSFAGINNVGTIDSWRIRYEEKTRNYTFNEDRGDYVLMDEVTETGGQIGHEYKNPCRGGMTDWNTESSGLLCETNVIPELLKARRRGDREVDVRVKEIKDVLACFVEVEKKIQLPAGGQAPDRNIHYEEICNCVELGSENLQVRAVVLGDSSRLLARGQQNIKVASAGKTTLLQRDSVTETLNVMKNVSFAQAEYFVDDRNSSGKKHEDVKAEWMWHMHWRARLRRTRRQSEGDACESISDRKQKSCELDNTLGSVFY